VFANKPYKYHTSHGLASNGLFVLFSQSAKKCCFKMLKMPNRLLQWLQNIQKPLAGLFRHLIWPKNEEDKLLGSPPFKLVVSASTKHTSLWLNLAHTHFKA
jgi:hypothetical protein